MNKYFINRCDLVGGNFALLSERGRSRLRSMGDRQIVVEGFFPIVHQTHDGCVIHFAHGDEVVTDNEVQAVYTAHEVALAGYGRASQCF